MKRAYALLFVPFVALILLGSDCELRGPPGGDRRDASGQTDGGVSDGGTSDGGLDGGFGDGGTSDGGLDGGFGDGGTSDGGLDGGFGDGGTSDGGTSDGGRFDGGSDGGQLTGEAQRPGGYRYVLIESLDPTGAATSVDTVIVRKPNGATYQASAIDAKVSHGGYVAELPVSLGSGDEVYVVGPQGPDETRAVLVSASPLPGTFSLLGTVGSDQAAVAVR